MRLFCFPYAGGSSLIYRKWTDSLPPSVEVCPIELPGRGMQMHLSPYNRLEPLVNAISDTIQPYLDQPFAFFGHSMGALVSFELARLLRKQYGISPSHLFVSGRHAPQILDTDPPIHALPESAFKEELRQLNGTPSAVLESTELMQLLLPMLRADFAVLETYVYHAAPPLECNITAFGGLQDVINRSHLLPWREQTTASFSLQLLPGDHFFVHSAQPILLKSLAEHLQL